MQTKVFWIQSPGPGKVGIVPRPRGGDWLEDETTAWRAAGIDVVVSLLQPEEETQLALEGEAAAATAQGIEFRAFPIPDRGVPASRDAFAQVVDDIVDSVKAGRSVAVHCRQGIGRSGMIVGGVLVSLGSDLAGALKDIQQSRGLEVPETPEQQRWLMEFASSVAGRAAQPAAAADVRGGDVV